MRLQESEEDERRRRAKNHRNAQIAYEHFLAAHERFKAYQESGEDVNANHESHLALDWLREWRDIPESVDVNEPDSPSTN